MVTHQSAFLLLTILVTAANAGAHGGGHPAILGTPTARFWEEALPGIPMPEAIADIVQKGIDHLPLKEPYSATKNPLGRAQAYQQYGKHAHGVPPSGLFFHEAQVHVGSTMTVFLPPVTTKGSLPRDAEEKLPLGSLEDTFAMFNITPGSAEAEEVDDTLHGCQERPIPGEQKVCAMSIEDVVLAATRMLGITSTGGVWAAASALPSAGLPRQSYVVWRVVGLPGERLVACHIEAFPYAVYRCHMSERSSRAYVISLQGFRGGPEVDMAAICHLDTSDWDPAHPAFKLLHTHPGGAPVCHFLPYANLVFGEKAPNDAMI
ncbi:unnamed protein product [Urochloa decumbens]|uniref:BURP domain-containing protein n=1 Tax=Urochloa decumbens TaxID=240449 RepID=A0ABC8W9C1_9POAL